MSHIDSAAASLIAAQQAALYTQIGVAVAAKQLDAQQQQGQAAVQLIEAAAQLAKEAGQGRRLDAMA